MEYEQTYECVRLEADRRMSHVHLSGPINTIAVHPSGKAFASGGEDGYVRVHWVSQRSTDHEPHRLSFG